ncbi:penicillin-binding protein activator [bacterium]|nr:penicillin-binding protein activator [bacterium]
MLLKKVLVVLLILCGVVFLVGCEEDDNPTRDEGDLVQFDLGGMLPLTGDLERYASQLQTFIQFGLDDANAMLANQGSPIRMNLIVGDTRTEGEDARSLAEYMHRISGINCVVGPLTSHEILALTTSSVLDSILVLSPGSTAPALALPGDNVFRFVTSDSQMANVLSQKMWDDGIRGIVTLYRNDIWGVALSSYIGDAFTGLGGQVISRHQYYGARTSEMTELLDSVSTDLAASGFSADQMALQLSTLEEGVELFRTANVLSDEYPEVGEIRWYGSDGLVQNQYMIGDDEINTFAAQVQYTAPIFGIAESASLSSLVARFEAVSDDEPWTYSFIAYDIARLIGEALAEVSNPNDLSELRSAILDAADSMEGVSGSLELNEDGDRAGGTYNFWQVVEEEGSVGWVKL